MGKFARLMPANFKRVLDPFLLAHHTDYIYQLLRTYYPTSLLTTNARFPQGVVETQLEFDCIVSNPTWKNKAQLFTILKKLDKPFALLMPVDVLTRDYFLKTFPGKEHIQTVLCPKVYFMHRKDGELTSFSKPFPGTLCFICYKMNLTGDLLWL